MSFVEPRWVDTVPVERPWLDTVPWAEATDALVRGPVAPFGRVGLRLGRFLWFFALTVGLLATAVASALGMDSQQSTYGQTSVAVMKEAGLLSLTLGGATLFALGLAAWLAPMLRPRLPAVTGQLTALVFFGIPWTVLSTIVELYIPPAIHGGWAALGGLAGLILWARLQSRCMPGAAADA